MGGPWGTLRDHFWKTGGIAKSLVLLHKMVHFGPPRGRWETFGGGKVVKMRGRNQETEPEEPWEMDLGGQRGPKEGAKGTKEHPRGQQVTHADH